MQLLRSCSEVRKWLFTLQILQVVSPFMSCNAFKPCHMDSKKILARMEISSCIITASLDLGIPPAKLTRLSFTLSWHILIILHAALGTEFTSSWLLAVQLLGCRELGKVRIEDLVTKSCNSCIGSLRVLEVWGRTLRETEQLQVPCCAG